MATPTYVITPSGVYLEGPNGTVTGQPLDTSNLPNSLPDFTSYNSSPGGSAIVPVPAVAPPSQAPLQVNPVPDAAYTPAPDPATVPSPDVATVGAQPLVASSGASSSSGSGAGSGSGGGWIDLIAEIGQRSFFFLLGLLLLILGLVWAMLHRK